MPYYVLCWPCEIVAISLKINDYIPAATPYRPGRNGFSKQHNTRGSGPADNIYFFYQRLWPGQIANTKSSLTLALGLMHLNFYLFYWPLLKNIFSQQVLDSNLSDNDGGLVDNEDDQEKEDSPMITDNDFDFLSNFLFTMSVCLTSTHLEHSISFRSVSALWAYFLGQTEPILLHLVGKMNTFAKLLQNCNPNVQKRKIPTT